MTTLVAPAWTPACMEPDELAGWQVFNARVVGHGAAARPCRDCLSGFAVEMRAVGRCNGTPHGVEEETDVELPATPTPPRSLSVGRRVALDVAAPPCTSCAHEPVCGLRLALGGIAEVETTAPALPGGLRLSLSATVSCDHFLRDRTKPAPVRVLTSQERGGEATRRRISLEARARMNAGISARAAAKRAAREGAATA